METAVKNAVYEMLCNLTGQGFLGKDANLHANTVAAITREIDEQIETFVWEEKKNG